MIQFPIFLQIFTVNRDVINIIKCCHLLAGVATTVLNIRKYDGYFIWRVYTALYNLYCIQTLAISHSHSTASPTRCLSFYHTLTHTQDLSPSLLLTLSFLISDFLTNKTATSRKVCWTYTHTCTHTPSPGRPCRSISAPQTSIWLLSLFAMLAEQSLSWFGDNPNRATSAFPYSEAPNLPDWGRDREWSAL